MFEPRPSDFPFVSANRRRPRPHSIDRTCCVVESLEQRQLLSADVIGGTLVVDGTDGNDKIAVIAGREPGTFTVKIKGEGKQFFEGIDAIEIHGLAGHDKIKVNGKPLNTAGELIGATIDGGDGNDKIKGSVGDDTIDAGEGDDKVSGGHGNDVIDVSKGKNKAHGNTKNDSVKNEPDPPADDDPGCDDDTGGDDPPVVTDDHGDTPETATPVVFSDTGNATLGGVIHGATDVDVFSFTLDADMEIVVSMDVASTGSPVAVLSDSGGTPIRSTADGFGGLFITNLTAGSYTFAVTGLDGGVFNVFVDLNPLA